MRSDGVAAGGPSSARMYDYFLGGRHSLEVDRAAGDAVLRAVPMTSDLVWENRRFLGRVVRHLSRAGIRQFVDIGPGLPTVGSTHEVVRSVDPGANVVYIDNDPSVIRMSEELLQADGRAAFIPGDLRDPLSIVDSLRSHRLLDLTQPVAVLVVAVLHFIGDEDEPSEIIRVLREAMAPGSYLALSHLTDTGPDEASIRSVVQVYQNASARIVFRPADDIERLFLGFDIVAPGFGHPADWHPEPHEPSATGWLRGGVGRLRRDPTTPSDGQNRTYDGSPTPTED